MRLTVRSLSCGGARAHTPPIAALASTLVRRAADPSPAFWGPPRGAWFHGDDARLGTMRCHAQSRRYSDGVATGSEGAFPVVPWAQHNANTVCLIGRLGKDPEVRFLENSMIVASFSLAVNKNKEGAANWFEVEMWNDLARRAENNLVKGEQVQVTGRLSQDQWRDKVTGMQRERIKIIADAISVIERNGNGNSNGGAPYASAPSQAAPSAPSQPAWSAPAPPPPPPPPPPPAASAGVGGSTGSSSSSSSFSSSSSSSSSSSTSPMETVEAKWAALFYNPADFWDNRQGKRSPKAPDFKHKETGEALWIVSATTPSWVEASLRELDAHQETDMAGLFNAAKQDGGGEEIPF